MNKTELTAIINALETAHRAVANSTNRPADTARHFIAAVGIDTAAQCVAAVVRRLSLDGRISRTARQWAEGVELPAVLVEHIQDAYTSIHAAHISQIAEAMPAEMEHAQAEAQPTSRPMYDSIPQALAIFDSLNPSSVHVITEDMSGQIMTGTPAELVQRIIEQDKQTNGKIDHGATTVEGWAIIETAYALSDGEAITTDDGRHVWSRRKR